MLTLELSAASLAMLALRDPVIEAWSRAACEALSRAEELPTPILFNTLPTFYERLARLLTPQYFQVSGVDVQTIAQEHGGERARLSGYDTETLIHEYQLFRQVLFSQLHLGGVPVSEAERAAIDTSIDSAIRASVTAFALIQSALREQFVGALTHDLRTPLSTICTAAQLIEARSAEEEIRHLASRIAENGRRIDRMTRDLLDNMVFEGGECLPLRPVNFDMAELAQEVVTEARECHPHNHIGLQSVAVAGCWCRESLKRALENLLGNAIKYGAPDKPILVKVDHNRHRVQLTVHNDGAPIPPHDIESIFQVYRRAGAACKDKLGWGVGLPYARRVAERHGGSIIVTSNAATGTTFMLDIPLDVRPISHAPTVS